MADGFDLAATFNDDYLYFYADRLSEHNSDAEAAVVWDIAGIHGESRVLDLACGHGQHVRHQPPFFSRPWVMTEGGRARFLGQPLNCQKCEGAG